MIELSRDAQEGRGDLGASGKSAGSGDPGSRTELGHFRIIRIEHMKRNRF